MSAVIEQTEILLPGPAQALAALLDVPVPNVADGEGLPLLWHWVYLLDRPAQADLGLDGHPVHGTVPAPPGPGLRRMWAGGRGRASGTLRCGEPATRHSRVLSAKGKQGRSGPLIFVTVHHQVLQRGSVIVDEQQDVVYRAAAGSDEQQAAAATAGPVVPPGDGERSIDVSHGCQRRPGPHRDRHRGAGQLRAPDSLRDTAEQPVTTEARGGPVGVSDFQLVDRPILLRAQAITAIPLNAQDRVTGNRRQPSRDDTSRIARKGIDRGFA
jgi:N-terminal half of MaoC dehydratase